MKSKPISKPHTIPAKNTDRREFNKSGLKQRLEFLCCFVDFTFSVFECPGCFLCFYRGGLSASSSGFRDRTCSLQPFFCRTFVLLSFLRVCSCLFVRRFRALRLSARID